MVDTEIDFFVKKFKQLWRAGYGAHLDIDAHAGQAWVGLRVRLEPPGPQVERQNVRQKARDGPSRQRRRARRAAVREKASEESNERPEDDEANPVETQSSDNTENTGDEYCEIVEKTTAESASSVEEAITIEEIETEETTAEEPEIPKENTEQVVREFVTIHATAIVEDSLNETLTNDEITSVYRFIASKDHLIKNIADAKANHLSSRKLRNCNFKHTIGVVIIVKTANLWEGARSYIWRHLGPGNSWTIGNGSSITLVKIHEK